MCCTKRREVRVVVSNQLTVLSRTRKKNVPPEIVKTARQAARPRIVSGPASSIEPCPMCRRPKLASYERRSPGATAFLLSCVALVLGAAGGSDCADKDAAAIGPISTDRRKRTTDVDRTDNLELTEDRLGIARHIRFQPRASVVEKLLPCPRAPV